jgi:hypothetical protein
VQAGDSQFANFEALDFCAADDQPANPDKPERQCTYGNSADSNCADRLRPDGQRANCNRAESSSNFLNIV